MNEGQFKHIENKIKEAADNLQPEFDEQAWSRMELLLDKEKDKSRPIFWWWVLGSFLIIASLAVYQLMQSSPSKNNGFKKNQIGQLITEPKTTSANSVVLSANKLYKPLTKKHRPIQKKIISENSVKKISINQPDNSFNNSTHILPNKNVRSEDEIEKNQEEKNEPVITSGSGTFETNTTEKKEDKESTDPDLQNDKNERINREENVKKDPEIQKRKSFVSKIYLTLTTGADASGLKLFSFSDNSLSLKSGIGLGYQLNKKISIETGFSLGAKKYIAGPGDYKYAPGSYWSTVDLIKVDANCFVYEIPLLLQYTLLQKPTTRYYAGVGLVSFIMKKEAYKYDYYSYGSEQSSEKSYYGNRHFFSSFQISLGVEKKLTENLSILATPSVSIPMQGIGNGKVKLYSTSIQAGIKYLPFK